MKTNSHRPDPQSSYQFPYIALMTVLCIFFLMLYAHYSKLVAETSVERNEKIAQELRKCLGADKTLIDAAKVEALDGGVKVTLPSAILFNPGSAGLQDWVLPTLRNFSGILKMLPEDYKVAVEGYTDNAPVWYGGDFTSNWELSLYRSLGLISFFIENDNREERFIARGYSEFHQIVPNDTPEHRAMNRRVEILIRKGLSGDIRLQDAPRAGPGDPLQAGKEG